MKTTARGAQFKLLWKEEVLPSAVVEAARMALQPDLTSLPYFSAADKMYSQTAILVILFLEWNVSPLKLHHAFPWSELFQSVSSLLCL